MSQDTAATEAKAEDVKVEEGKQPETIGEIIGDKKEEKTDAKMVPEAAFLEEKKARKALERDMKELRSRIEEGATNTEVSASLSEIAKEYELDPKFLTKLAATIRKDVETEADRKVSDRIKPFEEKERAEKIQKVFDTHFTKALGDMDEYKDVVNRDAIFSLSLLPQNSSKTIPQLIEETYGGAVRGKRSIETAQPHRGSTPGELDFDRANTDVTYLREVLADPKLKAQYDQRPTDIARRA